MKLIHRLVLALSLSDSVKSISVDLVGNDIYTLH